MKHLLLMLMMALVMPVAMSAQEPTIYRSVEQMPRFPGGEAALMKYIQSHVNYPEGTDVEGRVILQFVVETDGSIGEVKVLRSVDELLDKEAVRLIKSLPNFTPGRQNGQAVSVWYTLPVSFKRDGGSPSYPGLFDGYRQYAPSDSTIYRSVEVEQMPQFPGGEAALEEYIQSHLQYPEGTDNQGIVVVQFVVKADGSIGEVKVLRRADEALNEEAVRVVKSLPKFTPGRQNGQAVSVWYTFPVSFRR